MTIRKVTKTQQKLTVHVNELTSDEDAICPECGKAFADDTHGFWVNVVMAVTVGLTLSVATTISSKGIVHDQYFSGSCILSN